jgi:hypothetical protein
VPVDGGTSSGNAIGLSDASVYLWVNALGEMRQSPIAGGASKLLFKDKPRRQVEIYANDSELIWSMSNAGADAGTIQRALPDGAGAVVLVQTPAITTILVDGNNLYYLTATGQIFELPTDGGSPSLRACDVNGARCLAVDDTYLYWGDSRSAVWRTPK